MFSRSMDLRERFNIVAFFLKLTAAGVVEYQGNHVRR